MTKSLILTDVDGVLFNWQDGFDQWMIANGYTPIHQHTNTYHISEQFSITREQAGKLVAEFNNSPEMRYLPALRDAIEYIPKLRTLGYKFHAITSISDKPHAHQNREFNLISLFGKDVFTNVTCLATGADKDEALEEYRDSGLIWVEDNKKNAETGANLGLRSLLMSHSYNEGHTYPGVTTVNNWEEIYTIISTDGQ